MRIISGRLKGSSLYISKDKTIRPLKDLARESIFNVLNHSNKILFQLEKSNILDLYAGTGSFGLECLSRKARHVCFVENEKSAIKVLEKNIEKLDIRKLIQLIFKNNLLNENGIIILHRNKTTKEKLPDYFKVIEERLYGISKIIFGKF